MLCFYQHQLDNHAPWNIDDPVCEYVTKENDNSEKDMQNNYLLNSSLSL